jgi:hypothetical protein
MSDYYYKTNASPVLDAVRDWDAKRAEFDRKRLALKKVFGGHGSPMHSGGDNYVGGVKISESHELDVHWCRPDEHGYRLLRSTAKPEKGATKEARASYKAEHERLIALWNLHCPARISKDDAWKAIGIDMGSVWLCGGVFFEHDGFVLLHLGFQLKQGAVSATEIFPSELEAARQSVMQQRRAA